MIRVNTHDVKASLSYFLTKVEKEHAKIKIFRHGKPIALLVPLEPIKNPLKQYPRLMGVKIHEDPTAPLDEDAWPCDFLGDREIF